MNDADEKRRFRKAKTLETKNTLEVDEFIRECMKLHQGRSFMYWLLGITKLHRNPFTANALTTSFACGEANIGMQVQDRLIELAPNDYLKMLREKAEEQKNVYGSPSDDSGTDTFDDGSDPADNGG